MTGARRVLVTGYTGGLGHALVTRLRDEFVRVRGVGRRELPSSPVDEFVPGDVSTADWTQLIPGCSAVFHLAAFVHARPKDQAAVARTFDVNHLATARLAAACREARATLIFASTVAVMRGAQPSESRDSAPGSDAYAESKWMAEQAIRSEADKGLRFVTVRFPLLYGPHGRGNMERLLRSVSAGHYWPIGNQDVRKSCLFFADAAEALILAWRTPQVENRSLVVSSPKAFSMREIHEAAYQACGRRMPGYAVPTALARAATRAVDIGMFALGKRSHFAHSIDTLTTSAAYDGTEFAAATGFAPRTGLQSGLLVTRRWMNSERLG